MMAIPKTVSFDVRDLPRRYCGVSIPVALGLDRLYGPRKGQRLDTRAEHGGRT